MGKTLPAPAVDKLVDIIELLAGEKRGFGVNEISRALEMPVNTVFRICRTMELKGYFCKDSETALYQLGSRFFNIGQIVGSRLDIRTKALPLMKQLRDTLGETVHLCVLRENWMVLLDQVETMNKIRINVEPGSLMYAHASAFGKCLLVYADEDSARILTGSMPALTAHTITSPGKMAAELKNVREQGCAYDMEEYMEGVRCVGAPVHAFEKRGLAAIGIMGPTYRHSEKKLVEAAAVVKETALKLSIELGYSGQL